MPRVKNKILIKTVNSESIRHRYDEKTNKWYFSVVDLVGLITGSKNPRNYWKVFKNRLKKELPELVTKFNQLKMRSRDGKLYLTDVADTEGMLEIVKILSSANVESLREYFTGFLSANPEGLNDPEGEVRLLIDGFETENEVIIRAMVAGVSLGDLFILPARKKITIRGNRKAPVNISSEDYLAQELLWSKFSRTISLPCSIKTETVETTEQNGLLTIRLEKISN